jgi:hypothetical protein
MKRLAHRLLPALVIALACAHCTSASAASAVVTSAPEKWARLSPARITEIESLLATAPRGFGPDYRDRATFTALAALPAFASTIKSAEKLLAAPFPAWSDERYLDFSRTGRRPDGEKMLRDRNSWLATLVWAECLENRGRFIPRITEIITQLVDQPTWTLPAHDRALGSFHRTAYVVDLESSRFAHDLAQCLHLLGDKLPAGLRASVHAALRQRIFDPVLVSLRGGKGHFWLGIENNWNSVCLAGVTGAALATLPDHRERAVFVAAAEHYSRNFIHGFGEDGACSEGLGYYNFGFGYYIILREAIWQATAGRLDLFNDPKVRSIATYGLRLEITPGVYPAIADCRVGTRTDPRILWYCSRVLGLGLARYESGDFRRPGELAHTSLYTFANSASAARPAATPAPEIAPGLGLRSYFDATGLLICRPAPGGRLGAALQGGHNNESHNHNDVGSFTVALGGEVPVGDPGGPHAYTADTFGPLRYTKFQMFRSRTHPVPLVAGHEQIPGRAAAAKVIQTRFSADEDVFVLDLAAAYKVPSLRKLVRTFTFSRKGAGALAVSDEFAFSKPESFELTLPTHGKWCRTGPATLEFTRGTETLLARIVAPGELEFTDERIEENAPAFTRLGIKLKSPVRSGVVTVTFTPLPAQ